MFTWPRAQQMLPLVEHIAQDILDCSGRLAEMQPELDRLERRRRQLTWPERSRRYQLQDEIFLADNNLQETVAELEALGIVLVDRDLGQVGFPTTVNNNRAFFSWRPGESAIGFWHFQEEFGRRPIPPAWTTPAANRPRSNSKP